MIRLFAFLYALVTLGLFVASVIVGGPTGARLDDGAGTLFALGVFAALVYWFFG